MQPNVVNSLLAGKPRQDFIVFRGNEHGQGDGGKTELFGVVDGLRFRFFQFGMVPETLDLNDAFFSGASQMQIDPAVARREFRADDANIFGGLPQPEIEMKMSHIFGVMQIFTSRLVLPRIQTFGFEAFQS